MDSSLLKCPQISTREILEITYQASVFTLTVRLYLVKVASWGRANAASALADAASAFFASSASTFLVALRTCTACLGDNTSSLPTGLK